MVVSRCIILANGWIFPGNILPVRRRARRHDCKMQSTPLTPENLASYDAGLMAADRAGGDYRCLAAPARLGVDTSTSYPEGKLRPG